MNKEELQQCAAAKSDQIDADNLIGGITMDVTIKAVQRGPSNEQPLQLVLEETDKFYRPSKTFRRALIGCFGDEPSNWIGKRLRLVRNPDTMFGGVKVGGIEVSHASIDAPVVFMLAAKRGKKSQVSIDVIPAVQKPTPMPQEVKAKGAAMRGEAPVRGTISGNALEGDLTGIGPDRPVEKTTMDKIVAEFAKIGIVLQAIEVLVEKPVGEWMESDVPKLRQCLVDEKKAIATSNVAAASGQQPKEI